MPVTAQDFIDISRTLLHYEFNDGDNAYLMGRFDALLARDGRERAVLSHLNSFCVARGGVIEEEVRIGLDGSDGH